MGWTAAALVVGAIIESESSRNESGKAERAADRAAKFADPFWDERDQYAKMLSDLMADPEGQLAKTPGYKAGLDAVQRTLLAQGYQGSGKMMESLLQYGGNIFDQQVKQLGHFAGADLNATGTGGNIIQRGQENSSNFQQQSTKSTTSILGTLAGSLEKGS